MTMQCEVYLWIKLATEEIPLGSLSVPAGVDPTTKYFADLGMQPAWGTIIHDNDKYRAAQGMQPQWGTIIHDVGHKISNHDAAGKSIDVFSTRIFHDGPLSTKGKVMTAKSLDKQKYSKQEAEAWIKSVEGATWSKNADYLALVEFTLDFGASSQKPVIC